MRKLVRLIVLKIPDLLLLIVSIGIYELSEVQRTESQSMESIGTKSVISLIPVMQHASQAEYLIR